MTNYHTQFKDEVSVMEGNSTQSVYMVETGIGSKSVWCQRLNS